MKKCMFFVALLCLSACDNNTVVGKCLLSSGEKGNTKQDNVIVTAFATDFFSCFCFDNLESDTPRFVIPKDEFLFAVTKTETLKDIKYSVKYTGSATIDTIVTTTTVEGARESCDRECTQLCKKTQK